MLTIAGRSEGRFCDGVSRRDFLRIGGLAFGGLTMPQLLRAEGSAGMGLSHKAVIMVFLAGGPPHQDMFHLKPDAPAGIRGDFSAPFDGCSGPRDFALSVVLAEPRACVPAR